MLLNTLAIYGMNPVVHMVCMANKDVRLTILREFVENLFAVSAVIVVITTTISKWDMATEHYGL